jgi:thioredoxin-dependent peroxiredoxin
MIQKGKKAPAFKSVDQNGSTIALKDYAGQKVVLYFYPKDDTPGCTAQACNLRDNITLLKQNGIAVLGVSVDDVKKHKKFEAKYELPFTLIADTEKSIVEAYGVWGEKKFMGRAYMGTNRVTFLIDENGKVAEVIDKVDTANHTHQILELWNMETPMAIQAKSVKASSKAATKNTVAKKAVVKEVAQKVVTKKVAVKKVAEAPVAKKAVAKKAVVAKPVAKKAVVKNVATITTKKIVVKQTTKSAVKKSVKK